MLLVSSPSNFLPCGGSSYCCKSDALATNTKNKQSNASDIYNKIVHYSFPFINYFQGIFRVNLVITNNFCECVGG